MNMFTEKIYKEIKMWLVIASVIPLSALAFLFFIWAFGTQDLLHKTLVAGATAMFTVAVIWWFWDLHTIKTLIDHWDSTRDRVAIILHEIKTVKTIVSTQNKSTDDK